VSRLISTRVTGGSGRVHGMMEVDGRMGGPGGGSSH
jgi:hypothetical protein